jgi:hypothetical protein
MSPLDEPSGTVTRDENHETRTAQAIRSAIAEVPFYAKQKLSVAEGAPLQELLGGLPLLTRDKIRATLPKAWVREGRDLKAELAAGRLAVVEAGSGDARVRVLFDQALYRAQERRALTVNPQALAALSGEHGAYRDAVLWVPERGTGSCGAGDPAYEERVEGSRLYLNSRQDPTFWSELVMTRMLDELAEHETVGLLADPFYLDVLARHAAALGRTLDVRSFVALCRARPTSAHRETLRHGFSGEVFDLFGAREVGVLFVEAEDRLMHHAPFGSHVELLPAKVPTPGAEALALVVVTTLERDAQPLVRYVLGDLAQVSGAPSRFSTVPPLRSVEGRFDDAIARPDGAIVTPGAIDRALAPLSLPAYQVTQREASRVEIDVVGGSPGAAAEALAELLHGLSVEARAATSLAAGPDGKYHSCRRHIPLALGDCFTGAES